jgi:hypothetical protein
MAMTLLTHKSIADARTPEPGERMAAGLSINQQKQYQRDWSTSIENRDSMGGEKSSD